MKPVEAKEVFEQFVAEAGAVVSEFKPIDAVRLMLDFYQQERVEGCDLQADGDRLLFHWGTHEWGHQSPCFDFNVSRQFVEGESANGGSQSQLSLTCHFAATPELAALKTGTKWCALTDELAAFEHFIGKSPAFLAVGKLPPQNVSLTCGAI